jgi:hypothetical protein
VLFTFPSRYWCTIGYRGVLRLGGWSPHVQTGFHVSRLTRGRTNVLPVRGCHPLWPAFPDGSGSDPHATGLVPFRSPLLGESLLMSFPPATEMFQFAGFASILRSIPLSRWVSPFGDLRIKGCSPLPEAYRRVPRPSSPLGTKASTKCPSIRSRAVRSPCADTPRKGEPCMDDRPLIRYTHGLATRALATGPDAAGQLPAGPRRTPALASNRKTRTATNNRNRNHPTKGSRPVAGYQTLFTLSKNGIQPAGAPSRRPGRIA